MYSSYTFNISNSSNDSSSLDSFNLFKSKHYLSWKKDGNLYEKKHYAKTTLKQQTIIKRR